MVGSTAAGWRTSGTHQPERGRALPDLQAPRIAYVLRPPNAQLFALGIVQPAELLQHLYCCGIQRGFAGVDDLDGKGLAPAFAADHLYAVGTYLADQSPRPARI